MDKLEPLIRNKFWIIFGLTLPIALFAYYSASGKMAEATTAQETKIETSLNGVPKGDTEPNETYAAGAKKINGDLDARFKVQVQKLWELQTERMTWPKVMVNYIPDQYRGEIAKSARYQYMRAYPAVVERVWERVEPFVGDARTNPLLRNIKVDWPQKVIIDGMNLPHADFDMSAPAENEEIWDAQEDIWLLELIFDAVVATNSEASYVSDSPVRQIDRIELVAGSGTSSVMASEGGGDFDDGMGGMGGMGAMGAQIGGVSGLGGGKNDRLGGAGGMSAGGEVSFNVAEEFGPPVAIAPEGDESGDSDYGGDMTGMGGMGAMGAMAGGLGGGMQPGVKVQRYIGPDGFDAFEGPYRERGFYMSVIILQDRIPDFFAQLSSSPWPIRIGRFNIGPNPYAPQEGASGGGGGFGMAGIGMGRGGGRGDDDEYGGFGGGRGGGRSMAPMAGMGNMSEMMGGLGGGMGGLGGGMGGGGLGFGGRMGRGGSLGLGIKLPPYMAMPTNISPELRASPELVQMDFCGIITLYNPVTDASVEVVDDGSTEADFTEALEQAPETVEEAKEMAAEEAAEEAAAAAEGTTTDEAALPGAEGLPSEDGLDNPNAADFPVDPANPNPAADGTDQPPAAESPPDAATSSQ